MTVRGDASAHPDDGVPRLSVLMPSWNAAPTIEGALGSVLAEREVPLECIVIDDGSTDGTADLVAAMAEQDPRIVLLRVPANEGVSNARNRGLSAARGEWLAFHDADDRMLPGGIAALMRSTTDPAVLAVIGQRVWSDGERTWLSPLYDIPDIREPGRKSIATHPGLLYYASVTGKAFHRSLLDGLRFEGRVLGDQAWTIKALLRAGNGIEVIDDTVFEWSRPHPDRFVATITSVSRSSAAGSIEMAIVARTVYRDVCAEVDVRISDAPTREAIKLAYFDRLVRSDMANAIRPAIKRRDPATGQLFDAIAAFLEDVPRSILAASDPLISDLVRWPAWNWAMLVPSARSGYWRMVRVVLLADRTMARRIATFRAVEPAYVFARFDPPAGPWAASMVLSIAALGKRVLDRLPGPWRPRSRQSRPHRRGARPERPGGGG
jgi:glycosyltransferase involved in cell wall biosynthesis